MFFSHINLSGETAAFGFKEGYEIQFGARSLARIVKETIAADVMRAYYGKSEIIKDDDYHGPLEQYVVELHRDKGEDVVAVFQH